MNQSIVIYGPQGCGKTRHGARLARHYGLDRVADLDGMRMAEVSRKGTLYLATQVPAGCPLRAISFQDAIEEVMI